MNINNVGEVEGAYEVNLSVDGEVVYSENVTLAGRGFLLGISQEK